MVEIAASVKMRTWFLEMLGKLKMIGTVRTAGTVMIEATVTGVEATMKVTDMMVVSNPSVGVKTT